MTDLTRGTDWGSYLYWDEKIQFNWQELYSQAQALAYLAANAATWSPPNP